MSRATTYANKVCLIVGASSGIGRCLALALAKQGANLALVARRENRLGEVRQAVEALGAQCQVIACNATSDAQSETAVAEVIKQYGQIDIAVLNAGGAPAIDTRSMNAAKVNHYMRSNYDVTVNFLFPVLAHMKERRSGQVVHTNSLAGFLGLPLQGPYCAAKGATRLLIDTCRLEYAEYGIHFCTVYPGFVATEATRDDGMPAPLEISEEAAADHIVRAMQARKNDYLFPWHMRWLIRLAQLLPKPAVNLILKQDVKPLP